MLLTTFTNLSLIDRCGQIFLYTTLLVLLILAVIFIITKKKKPEKLHDFNKFALGLAVGYTGAIIICMAFLTFQDMSENGEIIKELFYPILSIIITAFVLFVVWLALSFLSTKPIKNYKYIALGIIAIPVIISIVFLSIYYKKTIIPSNYYSDISDLGLILSTIGLLLAVILLPLFLGKKSDLNKTKSIVYASVCIALSFALSYIRLFKLPQGGSVTFVSLVPLMIYSRIFGIRKGVLAGVIYGVLQAVQDPWIIHPAQFLLDYPLAFGMIGLSGLFSELNLFKKTPQISFAIGGVFAVTMRYFCHLLSGIFAFASYAPEQFNAVSWSFLYNTFTFADGAIAIIVGVILLSSKNFTKSLEKISLK